MTKQPLAIGIENYKEIIEKNYYYIDKSCMIKDLIEEQGKVNLFTRPRRFGKTLALSMIRTFFEKEYDITGNLIDNTEYFAKMKIWQEKEICEKYQGKYPVITLSLKSAKQPTFELAYQMIVEQIASEFKRHRYLLKSDVLLEDEKKPAVILELKYAEKFTQMEEKCKEALNQIDEKGYADGLTNEGYEKILKYGICFCQKSCRVFI